ncbi:MAG: hypothetical protein ACI351_07575 [Candidatus Avelusimicrobium sp.]|uniref:hypothetical protein n=1 Tax=Candidatus Avelusimicrobium sp. TaxID=3048833 RepID=UPI003F03ABB0
MEKSANEKVDSFLGYFVEAPRALYHIISDASVAKVQIEHLDDVSVFDYDNKIKKMEQIKYKSPCNFTDHSKDLWNTLYNWFTVISNKRELLRPDTKFVIYTWNKCKIGPLANDFLNIKKNNNFDQIWEKQEKYFKTESHSDEIKRYFEVMNKDKDLVKLILTSFYIEQPNTTSSEDFEKLLEQQYGELFHPVRAFNIHIKGCFGLVLENPELKEAKLIEFTREQFDFYKDRYNRVKTYHFPDIADVDPSKVKSLEKSLMAKQLEEIGLEGSIENAIIDCVAWDALCIDCLMNGYLSALEIRKIYDEAKAEWIEHKNYLARKNQRYDGAELYERCCREKMRPKSLLIQGSEKRVTRGIYNNMANKHVNDRHSVGWHYKYQEKFKDFYEKDI